MRLSRKIKHVAGPVAFGSASIMFENPKDCAEFIEALLEFRNGRVIETHYFEGGKTERDVTDGN